VTGVAAAPGSDGTVALEVVSEQGRDVRRDLAATIVGQGWGLLELRPMRMSLEEIFLSLTTEEAASAETAREEEVVRA
jgi:ABC-2 type transport system ATP-binding protein